MPTIPNRARFDDCPILWAGPEAGAVRIADAHRTDWLTAMQDDGDRIDLSPLRHQLSDDLLALAEMANPDAFAGPAPDLNPFPALMGLLHQLVKRTARLLTWLPGSPDTLPQRIWGVTGAQRHAGNNQPG